jgi:hypothetical protein
MKGFSRMSLVSNLVTPVVALLGVLLGGWVTVKNQDRLWNREHARQWRDARLATYKEFLDASASYVAFSIEPTSNITAMPNIRFPGLLIPVFDEIGRPYKERLDSAQQAVRLLADSNETIEAAFDVVRYARDLAAATATHSPAQAPPETFERLFAAQKALVRAFRTDIGLSEISPAQL